MNYDQIRDVLQKNRRDTVERMANAENARLQENIRDQSSELSVVDNHPADMASEEFMRSMDVGQRVRDKAQIDDIDAALHAMDEGTYGKCENCGQTIDIERLQAMPTARLCVDCQRHDERHFKVRERPVEEEVLAPGFGQYDYDHRDYTAFDAEDSYQAVARYNIGSGDTDMNEILDALDLDDNEGIVDDMDRVSETEYENQLPPSASSLHPLSDYDE